MTAKDEPAQALLQTLEVKKYQWTLRVDHHFAVTKIDCVIVDIPGREIRPNVFDDSYARRQAWKRVEVSLIGETASVHVIMAPINAFLTPPSNDSKTVRIVAQPDPSDIVDSELAQPRNLGGVAMRNDRDRSVVQFVIDRIGLLEEVKIAVEVGHPFGVRLSFQHIKHPGWRACEVIFDNASTGTSSSDLGIGQFKIFEPHWYDPR